MNPFKASMESAAAGMAVQTRRIEVTSENISNADTPGYRRKLIIAEPGAAEFAGQLESLRLTLDETPGELRFQPEHPMADEAGFVTLSNVSLVTEMADMREANRGYEANLNAFQQARTMFQSLLDVLKR